MDVRAIVAVSPSGLIGLDGNIPWKKSQDLKRFKARTMGGTLIMGRKTWDSIGHRKLPGRETIVISRTQQEGVVTYSSLDLALVFAQELGKPVWVCGGAEIYSLAYSHLTEVDLTIVRDAPTVETGAYFSEYVAGLPGFTVQSQEVNSEDATLLHCLYVRST